MYVVVLCSGYASETVRLESADGACTRFVHQRYRRIELTDALREALAELVDAGPEFELHAKEHAMALSLDDARDLLEKRNRALLAIPSVSALVATREQARGHRREGRPSIGPGLPPTVTRPWKARDASDRPGRRRYLCEVHTPAGSPSRRSS